MGESEQTLWVGEGEAGSRLDRFLVERFPEISRGYLQDLIERGTIEVNGRKGRKSQSLVSGDRIEVGSFLRPEERKILPNSNLEIPILHQFSDYIVVDKPARLPTHPNQFLDSGTLANALLARFPSMVEVGDDRLRPGIVHRLDTDTSGLLLVALTPEGFAGLRSLFNERTIAKEYLALVLGKISQQMEISLPVAHHPRNPRKMVVVKPGTKYRSRLREACTRVSPIEDFGNYSLVRVKTLTGRMHQVRVHLGSVGHPLAGDQLYQKPQEKLRDQTGLTRHFLHAVTLQFADPFNKEPRNFESELPEELEALLERLRSERRFQN